MEIKKVDINEYKIDEFNRANDEVLEYKRRIPQNEESRNNHNSLFLKRSFYSADIHVREMLGYLIAKECGIPACETELAIYPTIRDEFEDAVISYAAVSKNDKILLPITLVNAYRRRVGTYQEKNSWMLDIESVFNTVFGLMGHNERPTSDYDKFVQDFITMLIYDIKFVNSDRDYKNWYIRQNTKTNEIDLYPLFDNASIFASENAPIKDITDEQAEELSNNHPLQIITPEDYKKGKTESSYKDMLTYLLKKYPKQTSVALEKVEKVTKEKLEEMIDSIPNVDKYRKEQMLKVFAARDRGVKNIYKEFSYMQKEIN